MPYEVAFDEGIQAIINRGHGDVRHLRFGADEDLLDGGMIALLEQNIVHMLPLRRETKAAGGEPLVEAAIHFGMVMRTHYN